jgi:taurine dioxygenase
MVCIEGMPEVSSRKLLDELTAHAIQPKYVYRHIWRNHDVIMWDNRCTMHSVEPFDNNSIRRIMHRVTLVGEAAPVAA